MITRIRTVFAFRTFLLLGVLVSGWAGPSPLAGEQQQNPFRILFIGNSHLFLNDVPDQVRARLRPDKGTIEIEMFASGGARLVDFTEGAEVAAALKRTRWDVVVLQEASISFLSTEGRRDFHRALDWFLHRLPDETRVVLYQTWPWRNGSPYLFGRTAGEKEMWAVMQAEYAKARQISRIVVAPVGRCWVNSPRRAEFYSADGNHATAAGSSFAAAVIAATISNGRHAGCPDRSSRSRLHR